jgi:hypothetical protein
LQSEVVSTGSGTRDLPTTIKTNVNKISFEQQFLHPIQPVQNLVLGGLQLSFFITLVANQKEYKQLW